MNANELKVETGYTTETPLRDILDLKFQLASVAVDEMLEKVYLKSLPPAPPNETPKTTPERSF